MSTSQASKFSKTLFSVIGELEKLGGLKKMYHFDLKYDTLLFTCI